MDQDFLRHTVNKIIFRQMAIKLVFFGCSAITNGKISTCFSLNLLSEIFKCLHIQVNASGEKFV